MVWGDLCLRMYCLTHDSGNTRVNVFVYNRLTKAQENMLGTFPKWGSMSLLLDVMAFDSCHEEYATF